MRTTLTTILFLSALAACGGGTNSQPSSTPSGSEGAPQAKSGETAATGGAQGGGNKPLVATQYADSLRGMGLDPSNLPELNKLTPEQLRKVMGLFSKSLGVDCKFCHTGGNMRASTPHKSVATRMWNEWVHNTQLVTAGANGPIFCDSCHQGRAEFLDKSNHEALAGWMKTELVERMHKTSGDPMSCQSCHGKPFDGHFLEKWEKN